MSPEAVLQQQSCKGAPPRARGSPGTSVSSVVAAGGPHTALCSPTLQGTGGQHCVQKRPRENCSGAVCNCTLRHPGKCVKWGRTESQHSSVHLNFHEVLAVPGVWGASPCYKAPWPSLGTEMQPVQLDPQGAALSSPERAQMRGMLGAHVELSAPFDATTGHVTLRAGRTSKQNPYHQVGSCDHNGVCWTP